MVSKVNYYDGMVVDQKDLDDEQKFNKEVTSNNVLNFEGSGVLKRELLKPILFDSNDMPNEFNQFVTNNAFDGKALPKLSASLPAYGQPSDITRGVQLEIIVSDSVLLGHKLMTVVIIGKNFEGLIDLETITFEKNGTLITKKHFTTIEVLMFNGFKGNPFGSVNNGGNVIIKEADDLLISEDALSSHQSESPNISLREMNLWNGLTNITAEIQVGLGALPNALDANDLEINVTPSATELLAPADTVSKAMAQKFIAETDNVQKVTVLLAIEDNGGFDWSGDITVSIKELQTATSCPTDQIPANFIDFDPKPEIIAEISMNKLEMEERGVVLDDTPVPVDFVFTNHSISSGRLNPSLVPGNFYAVCIRRTGDNSVGTVIISKAVNNLPENTGHSTLFTGTDWVDNKIETLWFEIYSDSVRSTSGTAYESGIEINIPKTKDDGFGTEKSFVDGDHNFFKFGRNDQNFVQISASELLTDTEPHPRTGNSVKSRIETIAELSVFDINTAVALKKSTVPLLLASAKDNNPRGNPSALPGTTSLPGLALNDKFIILNPGAEFLNNNIVGSIIVPDITDSITKYRIIKAELFTDLYGDVNGDGEINIGDLSDLSIFSSSYYANNSTDAATLAALYAETIDAIKLLRADVTANADAIDSTDSNAISNFITIGSPFAAGTSFQHLELTLEEIIDPESGPVVIQSNLDFVATPFEPINFRIEYIPTWDKQDIIIKDLRRFITSALTSIDYADECDNGQNEICFPDNIFVQDRILTGNRNEYHPDIETNVVSIRLPGPDVLIPPPDGYNIDVFDAFVIHQINGRTSKNFPAMKFADGTFVDSSLWNNAKLALGNHVKVTAALQGINTTAQIPLLSHTATDAAGFGVGSGSPFAAGAFPFTSPTYEDELNNGNVPIFTTGTLTTTGNFAEFITVGGERELIGNVVKITGRSDGLTGIESGIGQKRTIIDHTEDVLTVTPEWDIPPGPTSDNLLMHEYLFNVDGSDNIGSEDLTLISGATVTTSKSGFENALDPTTGTSDAGAELNLVGPSPADTFMPTSGGWTIEFFAFANTMSNNDVMLVMEVVTTSVFEFKGDGPNSLELIVNGSGVGSIPSFNTGEWTHVAIRYSGGNVELFYNGISQASFAAPAFTAPGGADVVNILVGNDPSWNRFDGKMDALRFWSRALDNIEIINLKNLASDDFKITFDYDILDPVSDPQISLHYEENDGILRVHFKDIDSTNAPEDLDSRIVLTIELSKSGFLNKALEVSKDQFLDLIF